MDAHAQTGVRSIGPTVTYLLLHNVALYGQEVGCQYKKAYKLNASYRKMCSCYLFFSRTSGNSTPVIITRSTPTVYNSFPNIGDFACRVSF